MKHQVSCSFRRFLTACVTLAFLSASAGTLAQRQVLEPEPGSIVERIDREERISGNAATGFLIRSDETTIGLSKLWAYLSNDQSTSLTLTIDSVDGRYHGEARFSAPPLPTGTWLPVTLDSLSEFGFLENYSNPIDEVAVLLRDDENSVFYPLRWGPSHADDGATVDGISNSDRLLIYVNTERAQAFVVEQGRPSMCRDASELSGFKFNAICEISIEEVRVEIPDNPGKSAVPDIRVHRRVGTRSLQPVELQLQFEF